MTLVDFGNKLFDVVNNTKKSIFKVGELIQLSHESHIFMIQAINDSNEDTINLKYPVGKNKFTGETLLGESNYTKEQLIQHFDYLKDTQLPITGIFWLISLVEVMLNNLVRELILRFPKKISSKKTVPISLILSNDTLEGVQISVIDALLNELTYKSPRDFAESIKDILSINLLESPAFQQYIEVKATRDIHIHNNGIANETYVNKASSLARIQSGQPLPVNINYFLDSYETCLQLTEFLVLKLNENWPSQKYEDSMKQTSKDIDKPEEKEQE